jgi:CHAD domain-containing protein
LSIATSTTTARQRLHEVTAASSWDHGLWEGLLRERLRKFMALLLRVLSEDSYEAVHDLRVWSRRLQQVVTTLSPSPRPPQARAMVRALRGARRSVGGWRDCDVLINLLEHKARRMRNPEERQVCEKICALAMNKRQHEIRRARRKLANRKLFTLALRAQKVLDEVAHDERRDAAEVLAKSIAERYEHWCQALSLACDDAQPMNIHAFRIRTKQLRYRIELARDLGERDAKAPLSFLKSLQDELGCWHDRAELFGLNHPRLVATVLRKSDREQAVQGKRIRRLLTNTHGNIGGSALDDWVARYCREKPSQPPASAEPRSSGAASNGDNCALMPNVVPVEQTEDVRALLAEPV